MNFTTDEDVTGPIHCRAAEVEGGTYTEEAERERCAPQRLQRGLDAGRQPEAEKLKRDAGK